MMYETLVEKVCYHIQKANFMGLKEAESTLLLAETANAIEELTRRCEQFQYMLPPAWIPVTERPPRRQDEYLVLWKFRKPMRNLPENKLFYAILEYDPNRESWVDDLPQSEPFGGYEVVYWMELPKEPEQKEE